MYYQVEDSWSADEMVLIARILDKEGTLMFARMIFFCCLFDCFPGLLSSEAPTNHMLRTTLASAFT